VTDMSDANGPADVEIDPKSTVAYRGLKAAVIILGVLMAIAVVLVVVGIAMRMSGHAPGQSTTAGSYSLPGGSKILSLQVAGNRMIMAVQEPGGNRVLIFSTDDGHLIGQIIPEGQK
jgi:hypothetical protein